LFSGLKRVLRLCWHECEFLKNEGSFTLVLGRLEARPNDAPL
jgi:hypothetical protein